MSLKLIVKGFNNEIKTRGIIIKIRPIKRYFLEIDIIEKHMLRSNFQRTNILIIS